MTVSFYIVLMLPRWLRWSEQRKKTRLYIKGKWSGPGDTLYFALLSDEGESFNPLKVDVFLQTLLSVASKSFSHSFSALGK